MVSVPVSRMSASGSNLLPEPLQRAIEKRNISCSYWPAFSSFTTTLSLIQGCKSPTTSILLNVDEKTTTIQTYYVFRTSTQRDVDAINA